MLSSPNIKLTNWLVGSGHQSVVVFFVCFFGPSGPIGGLLFSSISVH